MGSRAIAYEEHNGPFDPFKNAMQRNEFVGIETLVPFRCFHSIQMGYVSANEDSRRVTLHEPAVLANSGGLALPQPAIVS